MAVNLNGEPPEVVGGDESSPFHDVHIESPNNSHPAWGRTREFFLLTPFWGVARKSQKDYHDFGPRKDTP